MQIALGGAAPPVGGRPRSDSPRTEAGRDLLRDAHCAARAAAARAGGRIDIEELAAETLASMLARMAAQSRRQPHALDPVKEMQRAAERVLKASQRRRRTESRPISVPSHDVSGTPAGRETPSPEATAMGRETRRERRRWIAQLLRELSPAKRRAFYYARLRQPPLSDDELRRRIGVGMRVARRHALEILRQLQAKRPERLK